MKCVSYNIQYGIGLDGQYDIGRICAAVDGADLIALQEVTRNNPNNGSRDMVAEITAALPGYFHVYGPNFEADIGSRIDDGRAIMKTLQFGNMVLSKAPIMLSRNLLLPRFRSFGKLNLQRGALEALVATPLGPVRFYSVHLDHRSPDERAAQLSFLRERVLNYPLEGGGLTGLSEMGFPEPPLPEAFVLLGDFNMLQASHEYYEIAARPDHDPETGTPVIATRAVDAALLATDDGGAATWIDPKRPDDESRQKRIDFCFVSAGLTGAVKSYRVDTAAVGSDHRPIWLELG